MRTRSDSLIRRSLGTLLLLVALNAFGGGWYGMAGADAVPISWLEGSPFRDYFIPSMILFVVVGGSALLSAISVFMRQRKARFLSFLCVITIILWLSVQIIIIGYVSWMQPTTAAATFIILLLALKLPKKWKLNILVNSGPISILHYYFAFFAQLISGLFIHFYISKIPMKL